MAEFDSTPEQQAVIDGTDGITVVDAGAGTGKTWTITQRYATRVEQDDLDPKEILLVTFTRNAAAEARERIVSTTPASGASLRHAPIDTFHGICHKLLLEHGHRAPQHLEIDERITESTRLLDDPVLEADRFRSYYREFVEDNPEHEAYTELVQDPTDLLELIRKLCAKGVAPAAEGWYRNGRDALEGDRASFMDLFEAANEPNAGASGPTQSDLRRTLSNFDRNRCYLPDAPSKRSIRGGRDRVQIDSGWAERAFDEDRSALFAFVHDVYRGYLRYALERNYLNFSFLQLLAFVLLVEDEDIRATVRYPSIIVDEFQDTSELQFKLVLLLAGGNDICVVGDWKQSIYSFQYANVENIRRFESRLRSFVDDLNADRERVTFPIGEITPITLRRNFRSTQPILDLADAALTFPATARTESPVEPDAAIVSLESDATATHTRLDAIQSDEQVDAVLATVRDIVGAESYAVRSGNGTLRQPTYEDIAILSRRRDFGRRLRRRADEVGIPVSYQGGVDLFRTDQGILVLAWLRIVESDHDSRGWAVVLEEAGYRIDEIDRLIETDSYPAHFRQFRDRLRDIDRIATRAREVLDRYGFRQSYADAIVRVIDRVYAESGGNGGDIVRYIERSIDSGVTHEVADSPGIDSVTVQTIHAAKGLEYPIVIIADMSRRRFPVTQGDSGPIRFRDPIGLRETTFLANAHGYRHRYDNWRYSLLAAALRGEYDEERRLLYVAMTRAEDHLLFTANERPSPFFESLPLDPTECSPSLSFESIPDTSSRPVTVEMPTETEPIQLTAHHLIDETTFDDSEEGRGTAYGTRVHDFAERYARGDDIEPSDNADERAIQAFIESLTGELRPELPLTLPLTIDGTAVAIAGIADLLCVGEDEVRIVDYKTDATDHAAPEYRKQMSVYYHVVDAVMPEKEIRLSLFYTGDPSPREIDPLNRDELADLVRSRVEEDSP